MVRGWERLKSSKSFGWNMTRWFSTSALGSSSIRGPRTSLSFWSDNLRNYLANYHYFVSSFSLCLFSRSFAAQCDHSLLNVALTLSDYQAFFPPAEPKKKTGRNKANSIVHCSQSPKYHISTCYRNSRKGDCQATAPCTREMRWAKLLVWTLHFPRLHEFSGSWDLGMWHLCGGIQAIIRWTFS